MNANAWFERHAQTLVGSLGRIVQQPFSALLTIAVIGVALALPLFMSVCLQNLRAATADWNETLDVSVYMSKKASPARTQAVARELRDRADVGAVKVISAADALAQFREASGFGAALDALSDNPLPDTLVVTPALSASAPADMENLQTAIASLPDVQTVQVDTAWVTRLHGMLDVVRRVVWLTSSLLAVGVVLVVGNTIRLDILNRRTEIEVMKLVGATDGFARRPFLYSGLWYGLGGGIVALLLCASGVWALSQPTRRLAGLYGSQFQLRSLDAAHGVAVVSAAIGLAWLGSWVAATRHIRHIEPT